MVHSCRSEGFVLFFPSFAHLTWWMEGGDAKHLPPPPTLHTNISYLNRKDFVLSNINEHICIWTLNGRNETQAWTLSNHNWPHPNLILLKHFAVFSSSEPTDSLPRLVSSLTWRVNNRLSPWRTNGQKDQERIWSTCCWFKTGKLKSKLHLTQVTPEHRLPVAPLFSNIYLPYLDIRHLFNPGVHQHSL